ncbi:MAG TPA: MFS transporter [Nocardioides sp.]
MSWLHRIRALSMDLTPLKESQDFRLLFSAGTVFYLGGMITYVAIPYQLYTLTGSNAAVGLVGLVELFPLIVFGLYGGALADHVDRRKLLIACGLSQAVLTALLALNAFQDQPRVWPLYVISFFLAAAQSMQRPSKEALLPRTVEHDQLVAANALDSFGMQAGVLVGPAIGGLMLAHVGADWCYLVDVVALLVASVLFAAMASYPHRDETTPPSLAGIGEGLRNAFSRRDLLGTYLVDIAAMLLAIPVVLFPALAEDIFRRPELLGLLYSAETVGALLATATSGWTSRIRHHGRAIVIAAACYGLFIGLAGLAPTIWLAMAGFALAGAADMISAVFRSTVWSQTIPEAMRGRLAGIEMLSYSLGPLGGQVRAGFVADLWTVRGSIASGGFACVAGVGVTAVVLRDFWRYDARTDEHARAEKLRRSGA